VLSLPRGRSVVTVHDMGPLWSGRGQWGGREGGPAAALAYRYSLIAMRRAAAVVAVSEATRRELLEYTGWPEQRVRTIHSGLDSRFRPIGDPGPVLARYGLNGFSYILHVGASSARKNLATVLRAMGELSAELRLVKAGAPLEAPERRLAEQLGPGRVVELGPVGDDDLPALCSGAEALVFPSVYEGFGWPPLEAMACGTPAAVSGVAALREIAGPGALVVEEACDHVALAAAVRRCLRGSPERAGIVARGLVRAAEFTWERAARDYLDLYRQVLGT
jgi:alpha-1,3-rhamnosyl/mannosyltransferase